MKLLTDFSNPIKFSNPINFRANIIDAHGHIGDFFGDYFYPETLDSFVKQKLDDDDKIVGMVASNMDCMDKNSSVDEIEGNLKMLDAARKHKAFIPLAVCKVGVGSSDNIRKLFKENPGEFAGLKFHPDGCEVKADDFRYDEYLEFAQEKHLPCVFHSGINWDGDRLVDEKYRYSDPLAIYRAAKKFPDVPVIMAHMGGGGEVVHDIAIDALVESIENDDANLYADISWVDCDDPSKPNLIKAIKALQNTSKGDKTDRLMYGSDAPIGENKNGKNGLSGEEYYRKNISDIKKAIRDNFEEDVAEELIDKIFYKNAYKLFCSNNRTAKRKALDCCV